MVKTNSYKDHYFCTVITVAALMCNANWEWLNHNNSPMCYFKEVMCISHRRDILLLVEADDLEAETPLTRFL